MAGAKSGRFPVWAIVVLSLLIAVPILALSLRLHIKSAESSRWDEMRRWCEDVARETRARDPRRPVLRGDAIEGNAWDDYEAALGAFASTKDLNVAADYFYERSNADPAKVRAIVQLHAPALQALRRGASRSCAQRKVEWENDGAPALPGGRVPSQVGP